MSQLYEVSLKVPEGAPNFEITLKSSADTSDSVPPVSHEALQIEIDLLRRVLAERESLHRSEAMMANNMFDRLNAEFGKLEAELLAVKIQRDDYQRTVDAVNNYAICHICDHTAIEPCVLGCQHIVCNGCVVHLQVEGEDVKCPFCRRISFPYPVDVLGEIFATTQVQNELELSVTGVNPFNVADGNVAANSLANSASTLPTAGLTGPNPTNDPVSDDVTPLFTQGDNNSDHHVPQTIAANADSADNNVAVNSTPAVPSSSVTDPSVSDTNLASAPAYNNDNLHASNNYGAPFNDGFRINY